MSDDAAEELVGELEEAANPVKMAAQEKASIVLTWTIGKPQHSAYTAMRVGISKRQGEVYVAPQLRGGRAHLSPKAKAAFIRRVQDRSLEPALEENANKVEQKLEDMIARLARKHRF